jgi:hypothetical protein
MHPEILRELSAQRGREMRAQARQAHLAKMASRGRRRGRHLPEAADEFALLAIPDYVDGSFRSELTGDQAVSEAGAGHHAA